MIDFYANYNDKNIVYDVVCELCQIEINPFNV